MRHSRLGESELLSLYSLSASPGFAGKSDLFALSLAVSGFNLLVRIPMGLAMRAPLEEAVELRREFRLERVDSGNGLPANPGG